MPLGVERRHNLGHLHFITFSCFLPLLWCSSPSKMYWSFDWPDSNLSAIMKPALFAIFALVLVCSFVSSCGSTPPPPLTLSVQPASAFLLSNSQINEYIQLRAVLSNGQTPLQTNWTTSNACVAVNVEGIARCNVTCAGTLTSTITASAQELSAQASITCQYN
jgi:hypothetical protein